MDQFAQPAASSPPDARRRGTVVITGSSGYLGRTLIARLAGRYDVVGLDFVLPTAPEPTYEAIRVDLTSDASVEAALRRVRTGHGGHIASVIHLAGYYDLSGDPSPQYDAVTLRGTQRLLRELKRFETEQLIFVSTMLVHAPTQPGRPIDEEAPLLPKTPYPDSKARTEQLIAAERGELPAVILRPAGIYDEMCHAAFLAQQIANIFERELISHVYPGDINAGQPYLHLEDLADAVERTVERRRDLPALTTLLLGEPETPSYAELQRKIGCLIHGEAWETRRVPQALAKAGQWLQEDLLDQDPFVQPWMIEQASDHYELDISRARTLLGWEPRHRLLETLPEMIARLKSDPAGWYGANKLNPSRVAAADSALARAAAKAMPATERAAPDVDRHIEDAHRRTLWAPLTNMALGFWLLASPFAYGLFDPPPVVALPPAAGHPLPAAELRNLWLAWSEMASGLAIIAVSAVTFSRPRSAWSWLTAAIGLWLLFAPLVFWTTSAAAYAMDTLVGMLVIVFAVMVPPQPGIDRRALASSGEIPLGWSYSPSSYVQRVPILTLAFVGLLVSRYLAAYQLGHIDSVWDPFFSGGRTGASNGTDAVITSSVSKAFPISDAGFGAIAYALDILTGAIGDRRRWRTMPWLVLIFGLLIVPLGAVSVGFIIIQPPVIGALCALCLFQAAITVLLIPYSIDEVLATAQFLLHTRRMGGPFWRTLLRGGPALTDKRVRGPDLAAPLPVVVREFVTGGVTFPWTLTASVAIGVYLICTPWATGAQPPLAHSDHILGCLVITVAATAMADVARAVRFANIPLGFWVIAAPFLLGGGSAGAMIADVIAGAALVVLSLPRGTLSGAHYGGWDRALI